MLSPGGALSISAGQAQSQPSMKHQQSTINPFFLSTRHVWYGLFQSINQSSRSCIQHTTRLARPRRAMHLSFTSRQPEVPILIVTPSTPRDMSSEEKPFLPPYPTLSSEAKVKQDELYEAPRPSNARRFILLALFLTSLIFLTLLVTCGPSMPALPGIHVKRSNSHAGLKVRVRLNIGVRNGARQHARDFAAETEQYPMADFSAWLADAVPDERVN